MANSSKAQRTKTLPQNAFSTNEPIANRSSWTSKPMSLQTRSKSLTIDESLPRSVRLLPSRNPQECTISQQLDIQMFPKMNQETLPQQAECRFPKRNQSRRWQPSSTSLTSLETTCRNTTCSEMCLETDELHLKVLWMVWRTFSIILKREIFCMTLWLTRRKSYRLSLKKFYSWTFLKSLSHPLSLGKTLRSTIIPRVQPAAPQTPSWTAALLVQTCKGIFTI